MTYLINIAAAFELMFGLVVILTVVLSELTRRHEMYQPSSSSTPNTRTTSVGL